MPVRYELDSEKAIPVIDENENKVEPVSVASEVIRKMTEPINIKRIYVTEERKEEAKEIIKKIIENMQ